MLSTTSDGDGDDDDEEEQRMLLRTHGRALRRRNPQLGTAAAILSSLLSPLSPSPARSLFPVSLAVLSSLLLLHE